MKKKITFFTGAGVSVDSGIQTFRDIKDGLWYNYEVDKVATSEAWKNNKEEVLSFHNMLRKKLHEVKPNEAHKLIGKLQSKYDVSVVTQNVDDLHEKGGAKKVFHIHGELMKCRSTLDKSLIYDCRTSLNLGDKCIKGSQLRPHTVLFGEEPFYINESVYEMNTCDILIIIGTSFDISYTQWIVEQVNSNCEVCYIDPDPIELSKDLNVEYIPIGASEGMKILYDRLMV